MTSSVTQLSDLNKATVQKILREFFKDPDLLVTETTSLDEFLGDNDNFASEIKSWSVTVTSKDSSSNRISFVIKSSTESPLLKRFTTFVRPFAKELFWYRKVLPALTDLCPELVGISPTCYYGRSSYENIFRPKNALDNSGFVVRRMFLDKPEVGLILLGDLRSGDEPMKMLDKKLVMTFKQSKVAFEAMAKLHGSWLKWQHLVGPGRKPDSVEKEDLSGLTFSLQTMTLKSSTGSFTKSFAKLLHNQGKSELASKWEKYAKKKMLKNLKSLFSTKQESKRSALVTLCHGDLWTNNMMFSKDETKVTFLDFQVLVLLHPARDIWYFLAGTSDAEFRKAHLSQLLLAYFKVFNDYLKEVNICMTFEEFQKEILDRRDFLFMFSPGLVSMFLADEKLSLDTWRDFKEFVKKGEETVGGDPRPEDSPNLVEIRRRLTGMLQEAAEWNFI